MMTSLDPALTYTGPIFDAHTHAVDLDHLDLQVRIGKKYGVKKALLIVHGDSIEPIERRYPRLFVYAKYFSGRLLMGGEIDTAIREAKKMQEEGYSVAKLHFAPFWKTRLKRPSVIAVDDPSLDPLFDVFRDLDIPVLIHISDPDTYYATKYPAEEFGSKEDHLQQFENRMKRSPRVRYQVAHFGAQPEIHRLDNLGRWFRDNPTLSVDTGSARWMVRELGRDTKRAREFLIRYADRIIFGTDCVSRTNDVSYYEGRYLSERLLMETDVTQVPLPFVDTDTILSGGTIINGLSLPQDVIDKIYWQNITNIINITTISD
ncbi:MAG: amidohydrolase [Candidatus Thorarchaeota archaeon]|nr:amidohydrolase [Candidatus Thorarchaeota archaeon]